MSVNTEQKIIKNKVGLLNLAEMLGSVSEACKVMGYSRDSFYRFKEQVFVKDKRSAVESLAVALAPESTRLYHGTARNSLTYLGADHPEVVSLDQLRRDPRILAWRAKLRSRVPPLAPVTYISRLIPSGYSRRTGFQRAASGARPTPPSPRCSPPPRRLPRALTSQQDQLLQQELLRRNDLGANVLLLLRHAGMRIGEAADLSFDCLHASGADQSTIHVPLGKLKTERMVPVDSFVCQLVQRLRFFRSFDPLPADGRLLARSSTREALIRHFADTCTRSAPRQVSRNASSPTSFVTPMPARCFVPASSFFPS
jgi:integrase